MSHQVFISHSSQDRAIAEQICKHLEGRGLGVWMAPRDTTVGNYAQAITLAIHDSKVFIVLLSKHSNASRHVLSEVNIAFQEGVKMLPVKLDELPLNDDLRYYTSSSHALIVSASASDLEAIYSQIVSSLGESGSKVNVASQKLFKQEVWRAAGMCLLAFSVLFLVGFCHGYFSARTQAGLYRTALAKVDLRETRLVYVVPEFSFAYNVDANRPAPALTFAQARSEPGATDEFLHVPLHPEIADVLGYTTLGAAFTGSIYLAAHSVQGRNKIPVIIGVTVATICGYGVGYYVQARYFPVDHSRALRQFLQRQDVWHALECQWMANVFTHRVDRDPYFRYEKKQDYTSAEMRQAAAPLRTKAFN